MRVNRPKLAAALAAATIAGGLLASGTASAQMSRGSGMPMMRGQQMGPGMIQGYYGMQGGMMPGSGMMDMMDMMQGHMAGMAAFLKAEIGITPAQEPQWKAFADALGGMMNGKMHGNMPMQGKMPVQGAKPQSLPDALAQRVGWMESHLAALKAARDAAGPLYAVLTPEQKAKADSLLGCGPCGL